MTPFGENAYVMACAALRSHKVTLTETLEQALQKQITKREAQHDLLEDLATESLMGLGFDGRYGSHGQMILDVIPDAYK